MRVTIYQIIPELDAQNLMFRGWEFVSRKTGGRIPSETYACIYSGEVSAGTLEDVYAIFNVRHPKGYRGRSLSMSDVVEITGSGEGSEFYYCDTFEFKKVPFEKEHCIGGNEDE